MNSEGHGRTMTLKEIEERYPNKKCNHYSIRLVDWYIGYKCMKCGKEGV